MKCNCEKKRRGACARGLREFLPGARDQPRFDTRIASAGAVDAGVPLSPDAWSTSSMKGRLADIVSRPGG
ncbi:MAG: hypothetical protein EOO65_04305 [Methanosarcinales archaeon]|nr:MAG: hypothetical protein EOO65_04305 [Methanosarcinales archaeon]